MCYHLTADPKHQNFPSQSLTVGTSSKQPPPVSNHDHFSGLTVNNFSLFLTSCKQPLGAFLSSLFWLCALGYLEYMKHFSDNMELYIS